MLPWARLSDDGFLFMFRHGKWKAQICPFEPTAEVPARCGDWCPLFRNMSNPIIGRNETEAGIIDIKGIGFYLACQGLQKPNCIIAKAWIINDKWEEIDEYGNIKYTAETVSPAIRKLDIGD